MILASDDDRPVEDVRQRPKTKELVHSFCRQHMLDAQHFAQVARSIENVGVKHVTNDDLVRHRAAVSGALLFSVAFLETLINEVTHEMHCSARFGVSSSARRELAIVAQVRSMSERSVLLFEYQTALERADADVFNPRRSPFRAAERLVAMREVLVSGGQGSAEAIHRRRALERWMRCTFVESPLAPASSKWYLYRCLGAECAEWAVRIALEFSTDFCTRMSIPSRAPASPTPASLTI